MKRLAVLALVLALGGCSTLGLLTKSITNPVTKDDLYKIEASIQIAFIALNTYKRDCINGIADANCRANVRAIQQYTAQIPPYLAQLRSFVKGNDQVNAVVVYNQLVTLYGNAQRTAQGMGVKFGG